MLIFINFALADSVNQTVYSEKCCSWYKTGSSLHVVRALERPRWEDDGVDHPPAVDSDSALLARLGYKQELKRVFTPIEIFGLAFTFICPYPAIVSVLGFALPNGGPLALVWGWAVSAFFVMFIGLALAELGSALPTSGGLYYWTYTYASPRWRRLLSWLVGYSNTISFVSGLSATDWACAVQILAGVSIGSGMRFTPTLRQTFGVFAAIIVCHALIASLASSVIARLQRVFVVINIMLCFAIIIALPAATPKQFQNPPSYAFGGYANLYGWPSGWAFIMSFLAPLWTIGSFDAAVHMSEEAANAATAVPWAMIISAVLAAILGWGINVALAFCMGTDVQGIMSNSIGQPVATVFLNSFGQRGALVFLSFAILTQFFVGANILVVVSRLTFAFARDGALPFSSVLYRLHPRTRTPVNSAWACAAGALLLGLLALAGPATSSAIFSLSMAGCYIAWSIPIASRFLGGKEWVPGPFSLGWWGMPVAVIAVTWMAFAIVIFVFPTTPGPTGASMNYAVVVMGAWIALCLAYYYCPVYGGVHWFNGPQTNIQVKEYAKDDEGSISEEAEKVPL
ncbi:APC amino acid permease [Obba rivulosa]|uniref:APC amino acid permease n=1 Tax=Obba rivulosa TaxID=1052685 RepID=A0A8E2AXU6_9APHY|nr:APC amino acid permease [Obba rivulosa]